MSSGLWPALRPLTKHVRLLTFDHRGHGRSGGIVPIRDALPALADDAANLLSELGIGRAHVIGHSNGAFIGLHLALRHPELVGKLVLVGGAASGLFREVAARNAAARANATVLRALDRLWNDKLSDDRAFARAWRVVQPLYFRRPTPLIVERVLAPIRYNLESRRRMLPQYAGFDLRRELGRISAPTLVVVGRHDWITPPECAEEIARLIPRAILVVFERSGHYPFVEESRRFGRVVNQFLMR